MGRRAPVLLALAALAVAAAYCGAAWEGAPSPESAAEPAPDVPVASTEAPDAALAADARPPSGAREAVAATDAEPAPAAPTGDDVASERVVFGRALLSCGEPLADRPFVFAAPSLTASQAKSWSHRRNDPDRVVLVETDGDGAFRAELPDEIRDAARVVDLGEPLLERDGRLVELDGEPLELVYPGSVVDVLVLDPAGAPAPDVWVEVELDPVDAEDALLWSARTEDDGRWRGVVPGWGDLRLGARTPSGDLEVDGGVTRLPPEGAVVPITLQLAPPSGPGSIRVVVEWPDGRPVEHFAISVTDVETGVRLRYAVESELGPDGVLGGLPLRPLEVELEDRHRDPPSVYVRHTAEPRAVEPRPYAPVEVRFTPSPTGRVELDLSSLSGYGEALLVFVARDDVVPEDWVLLRDLRSPADGDRVTYSTSAPAGAVVFTDALDPGGWRIQVRPRGTAEVLAEGAVRVVAGEVAPLRLGPR